MWSSPLATQKPPALARADGAPRRQHNPRLRVPLSRTQPASLRQQNHAPVPFLPRPATADGAKRTHNNKLKRRRTNVAAACNRLTSPRSKVRDDRWRRVRSFRRMCQVQRDAKLDPSTTFMALAAGTEAGRKPLETPTNPCSFSRSTR